MRAVIGVVTGAIVGFVCWVLIAIGAMAILRCSATAIDVKPQTVTRIKCSGRVPPGKCAYYFYIADPSSGISHEYSVIDFKGKYEVGDSLFHKDLK